MPHVPEGAAGSDDFLISETNINQKPLQISQDMYNTTVYITFRKNHVLL